jgi:hypothetical protein
LVYTILTLGCGVAVGGGTVGFRVAVEVALGLGVGVAVGGTGVAVSVAVGLRVGVNVGVCVGVSVGVAVSVGTGVAVGASAVSVPTKATIMAVEVAGTSGVGVAWVEQPPSTRQARTTTAKTMDLM